MYIFTFITYCFVTGGGLATSASSHALGECSPPISPITMSHTTPSIYPSTSLTHNSYQPSGTTSMYNPMANYNHNPPTQYTSLSHHTYNTNKPSLITTGGTMGLTHHQLPMTGTTLTGLSTHPPLGTSMAGAGTMISGNLGTSLGGSMVPQSSYTSNTMANTTFSNPLNATNYNNPTYGTTTGTGPLNPYMQYNPVTTSYCSNSVTFSNPLSSHFNSLSLGGGLKLKNLDEVDLGIVFAILPSMCPCLLRTELNFTDHLLFENYSLY